MCTVDLCHTHLLLYWMVTFAETRERNVWNKKLLCAKIRIKDTPVSNTCIDSFPALTNLNHSVIWSF